MYILNILRLAIVNLLMDNTSTRKPIFALILLLALCFGCTRPKPTQVVTGSVPWYKTAIVYNLDVDTYQDSDGNGVGDFNGLTSRLDYLKWLGVNVIWLSPFQPTPDKDDGYDVADYYGIDKRLGTKADFDRFISEAKKRNIRVIMDLVLNHTSTDHPWFKQARTDTTSKYFNYYVWSKKRPKDWDKGMGFPTVETESWTFDPLARHYYFHRFYNFQPDLNIESADVRHEIKNILQYWLKQGLDGYRLDAVPFIIDLPKTGAEEPEHKFDVLTDIKNTVKAVKPDALLLGEANVEPKENINYFGKNGEHLQMMFNFYGNQYLFYGFATGNIKDFAKSLKDTREKPVSAQWAYFLRNHDEIDLGRLPKNKLKQVYSKFAPDSSMILYDRGVRRRLAPMFSNNLQQLKMPYSLLFSLPGTPVIRYGEEIAMGDDQHLKERLALRTPMQWAGTANAGFSTASHTLRPVINKGEYGYRKVNVMAEKDSGASLLNFIKTLATLRKQHPEIGAGAWDVLDTDNQSVFAIRYNYNGKTLLMVHNFNNQALQATIKANLSPRASLVDMFTNKITQTLKNEKLTIGLQGYGYQWYQVK
ncbi:trehalose synthase [Inquilinus sp. KBS0705]|nr:trehalose synthase [Inquilinus sp. KBS0705]